MNNVINIDHKLICKVKEFLLKNNLIKQNNSVNKIIVGLSGGPDSICLLNILKKLESNFNLKLIAAHLDHEWRDKSALDVEFCKKVSKELDVDFVFEKASNIKPIKKIISSSKEELGRVLRRQFLTDLLHIYKADFIALGHNYDDQIETFLIRLIRGSSISGLSCIKAVNNFYIRPLLDIKKLEILEYLNFNSLDYLIDSTNDQDLYLRNKIRKYVVPQLRFCDNRFDLNFKKSLLNLQKTDLFIEDLAFKLFSQITIKDGNDLIIDKIKFIELENNYSYLYHRIILLWLCQNNVEFIPSTLFFNEILKFIKYANSKIHKIHVNWHIYREKNYIRIVKV